MMNKPLTPSISNAVELGQSAIWLGALWMRELDQAMLEQFRQPALAQAFGALGWRLPTHTDAGEIETLQVDYCQLLIGPQGHVSPVESVWASNQFQSDTVDSMKSFFSILPGYRPPSDLHDHIGVQLDYLGNLIAAGATETGTVEGDAVEPVLAFVELRLKWTGPFLEQVRNQAKTDFYRGLATTTKQWISLFAQTETT